LSGLLSPIIRGIPDTIGDVLTLTVGGKALSGWQRVSVTRSLDTMPASFDIQVTERFPQSAQVDIPPGAPCTIKIGNDLVLTGYVDRYDISLSAAEHTIRVQGRSKSSDLVDCSALFDTQSHEPGMQKLNGTVLTIAQGLAAPYKVTVTSLAPDASSRVIGALNIMLGETAWEIIDRLTRYARLIAYDMPDGSVVLAQAGTEKMATGFTVGGNVETAEISFSMDERFSEYEGHMVTALMYGTDAGVNSPTIGEIQKDDGVPRFRKRYIVSEQTDLGRPLAGERALWEMKRRRGRSQVFSCVCDSWRDGARALWAPNHLAPIVAPQMKLAKAEWLIASVTYTRDESGNHAHLMLMDKDTYTPEPLPLQQTTPTVNQIEADHDRNNPTRPNPPKAPEPSPLAPAPIHFGPSTG
jgi:prophage tail gpP-like protein